MNGFSGGLGQTRTADLLITNEVHYLLCYETVAEAVGFEPTEENIPSAV